MPKATLFVLDESDAGVGQGDAPSLFRLRQRFPRPAEPDIATVVRREIVPFPVGVEAGQGVAMTGLSRGIANLARMVRECMGALRWIALDCAGLAPSPSSSPAWAAMAARRPSGQIRVLDDTNGMTEASVGCRIESNMEVVRIGTTATGFPVFRDKLCHDANGGERIKREYWLGWTQPPDAPAPPPACAPTGPDACAARG